MKIVNRTFRREYEAIEALEAGIVLSGAEVKSIRGGGIKLDGAHVKILSGEAYLVGAHISPYKFARNDDYEPQKSRKLLIKKKELLKWQIKMHGGGGLTIAPIALFSKGPYLKLEIALARGRKDLEKRKLEKSRDMARNQKRMAKEYIKG